MFQDFPYKRFLAVGYWSTWLALILVKVLSYLPLPLIAILGNIIGSLGYLLAFSRRQIAYKNIRICFPEFSKKKCHWINFKHFCLAGQTVFMMPINMMRSRWCFEKTIQITHRQAYDKATKEQKNIIVLAPHFMGVDVGGSAIAAERYAISMYQYAKNGLVDEVMRRGRMRFGGVMFERKSPLKEIIRSIRKGYPFYYLPDQDAGRKGIFVPFFSQIASTTPALAKFAKTGRAVVIPCQTIIKPWGLGFEVRLGEALANFPSGDEYQDTLLMNQAIEKMVRVAPEQYFWMHKRFKTQPDQEKGQFYR